LKKKEHFAFKFFPLQAKRKSNIIIPVTVVLLILGLVIALLAIDLLGNVTSNEPEMFVGVDVGFGDENDVYKVADAVQGYANLIIIGSLTVTSDTAKLTRVCDYLYQRGFSFIVYVGFAGGGLWPPYGPNSTFFKGNRERWGDKLLGAYMFDEPAGKQIDNRPVVPNADNNTDAATHFILGIANYLSLYKGDAYYGARWLKLYTSDYALYWYDYLSGYDVVLGEFVSNNSKQLSIALTRGAANTLGNDWGTMITWKYDKPPYLEEPDQLYSDMVLAYENGAKYIVVFNSPDSNPPITSLGILEPEHLDAMKNFWNYAKANPRTEKNTVETAYVLPGDFGYGFRGPNDTIWGLWPANATSLKVLNDANTLLETYGMKLDIVYENTTGIVQAVLPYSKLIFWNGTTITR